ncbi:hypothetical protein ACFRIC_09180 [Streptomyces sp. NPDC056738]|uniref:hypothetical protein n=1 Tax=Streptomyces sp. NPDC056738 TaxID=3345933 RepID=UPI00369A1BE8
MSPVGPVPGQLIIGTAAVALFLLLGAATFLLIVIVARIARWSRRRSHARRLLEDLAADMDSYLLDHPDVKAGLDRLHAAVRDEQQKGGTS